MTYIKPDRYAGLGPATIIRGNALALPLADQSVDLSVTSPPYFALRAYQDGGETYDGQIGSEATPDEFVTSLLGATRELVRVLKPSGSLWVNLGDKYNSAASGQNLRDAAGKDGRGPKRYDGGRGAEVAGVRPKSLLGLPWRYALRCIDELGLILRAEVVWSKPNGLPESVTDRVRRSHETWFHLVKSPRYFAAVDEIREPHQDRPGQTTWEQRKARGDAMRQGEQRSTFGHAGMESNPLGKLPGSVREVPTAPLRVPAELGVDHFAAFPPAWPAWIIRGWSPSGVCVECGEGRRPVVDKQFVIGRGGTQVGKMNRPGRVDLKGSSADRDNGYQGPTKVIGTNEVTITGYACACPTPDAPTRPAVILDPFGGTGTTAMAARALGRHGISVDLSSDYCRLARWRVQDHDQLATVRGVPRQGKPADEAQASLLDLFTDEASA